MIYLKTTSHVDTATDADRVLLLLLSLLFKAASWTCKMGFKQACISTGKEKKKKTKKKPLFSITEPIKDEVKIKEHNMGKI